MAKAGERDYPRLHLAFGWWTLLAFLTLGLVLDALHGFKVPWYVDVDVQVRRLMWTLAHTHGTLVGVVNIVFGLTLRGFPELPGWSRLASRCLIGASILLPLGFFLGGVTVHGGDPNPAALLVPPGGVLLIAGVFLMARGLSKRGP